MTNFMTEYNFVAPNSGLTFKQTFYVPFLPTKVSPIHN